MMYAIAFQEKHDLNEKVEEESLAHKDIVQLAFIDHYRNLTIKHLAALHWITEYCSNAHTVVKVDDDTYVNIPQLIKYVKVEEMNNSKNSSHIYCSVYSNQGPRRQRDDKWYVSMKEYPDTYYPPYCEGFAYITTVDVAQILYITSQESHHHYWIDDVYVTGLLVKRAWKKITLQRFRRPFGYKLMQNKGNSMGQAQAINQDVLFVLDKYPSKNSESLWKILNRQYNCVM